MERFQRKNIITKRALKYTYYATTPDEVSDKVPALLFLHGFPDSAHLWSGVIGELSHVQNQIIVPDCLGYAGTDKPTDTNLYSYSSQAEDITEILASEGVKNTIIIGHDWGSALAQRTFLHHGHLFCGLVLLNVGYIVPQDGSFDLSAFNAHTERTVGYPQFSYWDLFLSPNATDIIEGNMDRMWQALHGDVEDWMRKIFCVPDAMRDFLLGTDEVPLKEYAQRPEWKAHFKDQFGAGDFASALQSYKAVAHNIQSRSDATIRREDLEIKVPFLYISCTRDAVCTPDSTESAARQGLLPYLKRVEIESGHWSPMEKPAEIAHHISEFLDTVSKG
ncbi:epoxide hydrolase [Sarocladium strictum]